MIDQSELDAVLICRDLRMTMEAIMTRDQRTTSHRVLERGVQGNANATASLSYQNIINSSNNNSNRSSMAQRHHGQTRDKPCIDEFTNTTNTRKHKTDSEEKFCRCETYRDYCNCQNNIRSRDCNIYIDNIGSYSGSNRSTTSFQHKNHITTWLSKSRRQLRDYARNADLARNSPWVPPRLACYDDP